VTRFGTFTARLLATLIALLVAFLTPALATAHADYDSAEPAADAVVAEAPTQVQIWFTQDLFRRAGMNRIEVYDAAGQRVDQDDTTIDDDNRRLMTVSLQPELADGVYTVRWYSLSSEDGHDGEGEFTFTVARAGAIAATGEVTTTTEVTTTDDVTMTAEVTATGDVTATDEVTATDGVAATATVAAEPTVEASPTTAPTAASTPTPAPQSRTLPCVGGAAPLVFALGSVLAWRRRTR
jgi:methionine-rich copper-binding protein CopC